MTKDMIKKEYMKNRKRILRAVNQAKKEGYDTSGIKVPEIPKKITEGSIRRLQQKKYTTKEINKQVTKTSETGEKITREKAIIRKRWKKQPPKIATQQTHPITTETLDIDENIEVLDEFSFFMDKIYANIETLDGLDRAKYSAYSPTKKEYVLDSIVRNLREKANILEGYRKNPMLPESVKKEMYSLADENNFITNYYSSADEQALDNIMVKIIELAKQLEDTEIEESASELYSDDEFVEVSHVYDDMFDFML